MNIHDVIDFRFADEFDITDIVQFVNAAHKIENEEGVFQFRKDVPKIHIDEIERDFQSYSIRWIILETAFPEETLVGAARITVDKDMGRVYVDTICAIGSSTTQDMMIKLLVSKIESISFNFGVDTVVIAVPHWRSDKQESLTAFGYIELSGHEWPLEKQEELLKHTMILEFHKNLRMDAALSGKQVGSSNQEESTSKLIDDLENMEIMDSINDSLEIGIADGDSMQNLVTSLFSALHASFPSGNDNADLSAAPPSQQHYHHDGPSTTSNATSNSN